MNAYPLIISAPFGNYIQPPGATATLGTFTLAARPGRWRRVARTVRYHRSLRSWTNQIGLRNPGIEWLLERPHRMEGRIVSVHGFTIREWSEVFRLIEHARLGPQPVAWELNVSCPNVTDEPIDYRDLFDSAGGYIRTTPVIVKLPPIRWKPIAVAALSQGLTRFHACNTLPVPAGGISGQVLKPLALDVVRSLRAMAPKAEIIGGGGISRVEDIAEYRAAGADRFAIGSALFNPWFAWRSLGPLVEVSR